MTIEDIRNLIIKGKHEKALDAMLEIVKANDDDDLQNSLILQSGRFQGNERQNRLGLITSDNYSRTTNQITMALLSYLDDMKDNGYEGKTGDGRGGDEDGGQTPSEGIKKILFLASNPSGTGKLQLEKEHSRISRKIQESRTPNSFPIIPKIAVTLSSFQEFLILEEPNIVHFSGHGEKGDTELIPMMRRGIDLGEDSKPELKTDDTGIILFGEDMRGAHFIETRVIQHMFKVVIQQMNIPIETIIFNSCYSEGQAQALAQIVPYVVGTSWSVGDRAATAFTTGFYFGIAQGKNIETAFNLGITQAMGYNEPEDRFVLYKDGKKVKW